MLTGNGTNIREVYIQLQLNYYRNPREALKPRNCDKDKTVKSRVWASQFLEIVAYYRCSEKFVREASIKCVDQLDVNVKSVQI